MIYKYSKLLLIKIKLLTLDDFEIIELITCLYLNWCPVNDLAKLFNSSIENIENWLIYEGILDYRICQRCSKLKLIDNFSHKYPPRTGRTSICKQCKCEDTKKYRSNNFEYRRQYDIKYRQQNSEARKQYMTEYNKNLYQNNKTAILKHGKEYYYNNKELKQNYDKIHRNSFASEEILEKISKYNVVIKDMVQCIYCGNFFKPTTQQVYNRLGCINGKINGDGNLYCCDNCKDECPIYKQITKYKNQKNEIRYIDPNLRKLVFKRDNYTCQKCGKHQKDLSCGLRCHHIIPYSNDPIIDHDIDNCITICKNCHILIHQIIPGCKLHELKC